MGWDRHRTPTAGHFTWMAHGLFALTLYGSLIPFRYRHVPPGEALEQLLGARFYDPTLAFARGDWVVNMVQYAALSFCYMAALCVDRRWWVGPAAAVVVVPAGWAAAVTMEFLQVYFHRTVSVNDLAVEGAGVVLGCLAWLLAGRKFVGWARRFWGARGLDGLARQALPAYAALLAVAHLMPFDFVLGRDEIVAKFERGRIRPIPLAGLVSGSREPWIGLLTNSLAFLPLGILLGLSRGRLVRGLPAAFGVGLATAAAVELLQLLVYTRYCDATDVLTGALAVPAGWWLGNALIGSAAAGRAVGRARRWLGRRGAAPWLAMALGWAALLIAVNWQPFRFESDPSAFLRSDPDLSDEDTGVFGLRRMAWLPFVDYYWGSRYNALDQFLRRSASFAPLGVLLAPAFGRRERLGSAATVLAASALGLVVEAGQYFIPERHPGTTDLLIQVAGAWLGYRLARHVAHALGPGPGPGPDSVGAGDRRGPRAASARPRNRGSAGGRWGATAVGPLRVRRPGLEARLLGLPYGARLAIIGVAAVALAVGAVLILGTLSSGP